MKLSLTIFINIIHNLIYQIKLYLFPFLSDEASWIGIHISLDEIVQILQDSGSLMFSRMSLLMKIKHFSKVKHSQQEMYIPKVLLSSKSICDCINLHGDNIFYTSKIDSILNIRLIEKWIGVHDVKFDYISI